MLQTQMTEELSSAQSMAAEAQAEAVLCDQELAKQREQQRVLETRVKQSEEELASVQPPKVLLSRF